MDRTQRAFEAFDRKHHEVYSEFVRLAHKARSRGFRKYSAWTIVAVIRWHTDVNPQREGGFKINNNFISRYARKLIREDPSFRGFFELRACGGDGVEGSERDPLESVALEGFI